MDPTIFNIQLKNSFSKQRTPEIINHSALPWFSIPLDQTKNIILHERPTEVNMETFSRDQFELINCDVDKYLQLQSLKDQFNSLQKEIFMEARNNTNPYEKLGRSVFQNRAAVKLANIDALYNLTDSFNVFSSEDSPDYVFCDIASAPGSWSEYLQFRRPNAQGYAMSIRSSDSSLNFNTKKLNMEKMMIEYGPDNTGNLYTNHLFFANLVRKDNPRGVDLVMADGGFEVDGREDMQEILSSRLILIELLIAIKCLKENGKMLCKLFDSVLPVTQDIIYIASLCFEKISIIKPISSRPANAERYLIGHHYRSEIGINQIQLIEKILMSYESISQSTGDKVNQRMFGNLFDVKYTEGFDNYMLEINNFSIQNQMEASQSIIDYSNNEDNKFILIPELNLNLAFLLWKIPSNLPYWNKNKFNVELGENIEEKNIFTLEQIPFGESRGRGYQGSRGRGYQGSRGRGSEIRGRGQRRGQSMGF